MRGAIIKQPLCNVCCETENAIPFYEKIGMWRPDDVMTLNRIEWTDFTVE